MLESETWWKTEGKIFKMRDYSTFFKPHFFIFYSHSHRIDVIPKIVVKIRT